MSDLAGDVSSQTQIELVILANSLIRAAVEIGHTKSRFLNHQFLVEVAKSMKAIDETLKK